MSSVSWPWTGSPRGWRGGPLVTWYRPPPLARWCGRWNPAQGTDPVLAAATAAGAGVIVWGSYYLDGGTILIQANVTDATEERLLWAMDPVVGRDGAVVEIIETLRQRVAGLLACHYASSTDELGQVGLGVIGAPPSFEAYREFLAGREQVIGDMDAAIRRFRRAVELAPGFAPAWANLVVCHFNTGDCEAAAAVVDEMDAKCPLDKSGQEHMRTFFRARLDGRWTDALNAVQSLEAFAPHDGPIKILVATTALRAGRPQVAVDACSAIRLRGRFVRHPASIVRCRLIASAFHALGEHDRELDQVRAVAEVIPNPIAVLGLEVRALAAAGRFEEVESVLDRSLSIPAADSLTGGLMLEAAVEIRAHGKRTLSMEMAERAVAWVERRGRDRAPGEVLRGALCVAERWLEARELFEPDAAGGDLGALGSLGGSRSELAMRLELKRSTSPCSRSSVRSSTVSLCFSGRASRLIGGITTGPSSYCAPGSAKVSRMMIGCIETSVSNRCGRNRDSGRSSGHDRTASVSARVRAAKPQLFLHQTRDLAANGGTGVHGCPGE